jgi:hypothetical protein
MSQGCSCFEPAEKVDEVENLKRVGVKARACAPASGSRETPEGRRSDDPTTPRGGDGGRSAKAHGRRIAGSSDPSSGSRETLKRQEPQESIELAARLTPDGERRTPTRCHTLKAGYPSCSSPQARPGSARAGCIRCAHPGRAEARRARAADVRRVAGVERRYGFGWREKL